MISMAVCADSDVLRFIQMDARNIRDPSSDSACWFTQAVLLFPNGGRSHGKGRSVQIAACQRAMTVAVTKPTISSRHASCFRRLTVRPNLPVPGPAGHPLAANLRLDVAPAHRYLFAEVDPVAVAGTPAGDPWGLLAEFTPERCCNWADDEVFRARCADLSDEPDAYRTAPVVPAAAGPLPPGDSLLSLLAFGVTGSCPCPLWSSACWPTTPQEGSVRPRRALIAVCLRTTRLLHPPNKEKKTQSLSPEGWRLKQLTRRSTGALPSEPH